MYQSKKRCPLTKELCGDDCAWWDDVKDCGMLSSVKQFASAMEALAEHRSHNKSQAGGKRLNTEYLNIN
jgi:hypothetical protein